MWRIFSSSQNPFPAILRREKKKKEKRKKRKEKVPMDNKPRKITFFAASLTIYYICNIIGITHRLEATLLCVLNLFNLKRKS